MISSSAPVHTLESTVDVRGGPTASAKARSTARGVPSLFQQTLQVFLFFPLGKMVRLR